VPGDVKQLSLTFFLTHFEGRSQHRENIPELRLVKEFASHKLLVFTVKTVGKDGRVSEFPARP
jgi:hypothetical protein